MKIFLNKIVSKSILCHVVTVMLSILQQRHFTEKIEKSDEKSREKTSEKSLKRGKN